MSQSLWHIIEHTIPVQHVREYPGAIRSGKNGLKLAVKEYRPRAQQSPSRNAITVIAAHANGCPKECYEPLWDDLYHALADKGALRAIWIADVSNQGASGQLNEMVQGDDPSWNDHARDLLHMVNLFRDAMPQPIVGIGHSMGSTQFLALMEAIIRDASALNSNVALTTSHRPDHWPTRHEAEASIRKTRFFSTWDPRALDKFLQYGLRPTPTALFPEPDHTTLTTTKHQEAWSFLRSNFGAMSSEMDEYLRAPDLSPGYRRHLFNRPEMVLANRNLPYIRPRVNWVFGEKSHIISADERKDKYERTGTGVGGSGGSASGQIECTVVTEGRHMLPLEKTEECGRLLANWLERERENFITTEDWYQKFSSDKSERDQTILSQTWLKNVRHKESTPRDTKL